MKTASIEQLYIHYQKHPVITTDSRNCPSGSLFFALKGDRFNGNLFAEKALSDGCAFAIVDEAEYAKDNRYLLVDDVLTALQQLAAYHRRQLAIPVIGITGTNGKTTTKELTNAVLSEKYNTLATEGNLNNHIGVPLTLLKIRPEHEIAIIEMGANHPGEIKMLCEIADPEFGLITNVGKAHLEGFGSLDGVIRTKTELYQSLRHRDGTVFLHADNPYLPAYTDGMDVIRYGENGDGLFIKGRLTDCSPTLSFEFQINDQNPVSVATQLIGSYNLPNALAAAAIGAYFGVEESQISHALTNYHPENKRSQLIRTPKNTLILDAYNANPTSMMAALENFKLMKAEKKMLILGDMRELGAESEKEHQRIIEFLRENPFDRIVLVGDEFNKHPHPFIALADRNELAQWIAGNPTEGYHILIKGSRGIALEKGIDEL